MIHAWPAAIAHCDADAFFVGCELVRNKHLIGKSVVVVGKLGGIILSKSTELKDKGIRTGMPLWEAKKICPEIISLTTDFPWYNHLSGKLFEILRSWSPDVEVYSVDEAFVDLKGLRGLYHKDYGGIAEAMKNDVKKKLGLTVSIGVSVSKTLAKMAAEVNKPDGVTVISGLIRAQFLPRFLIGDVPGIGRNSEALLKKFGVKTCEDFVNLPEYMVRSILHRPGLDLWKELHGESILRVETNFEAQKMITRTSSFSPLTADQRFLWANTVAHLERAVQTLELEGLMAQEISLYLRDKDFVRYSFVARLGTATSSFPLFLEQLKILWKNNFPRGKIFRSTGLSFFRLSPALGLQLNLFENPHRTFQGIALEHAKQHIREKFGNTSIRAASSLRLPLPKPLPSDSSAPRLMGSSVGMTKIRVFNVQ